MAPRSSEALKLAEPVQAVDPLPFVGSLLSQLFGRSEISGQIKEILGTFNPRAIGVSERILMRLDPDVAFSLALQRAPIINMSWTVESNDDEIKTFVEQQLRRHYRRLAKAATLSMIYGFQVIEKVWQAGPVTLRMQGKDGTSTTKKLPMAWTLRRSKAIDPRTITLIADPFADEWVGVRQSRNFGDGRMVFAGRDRAMLWSFRSEEVWGKLTGYALIDQAYEPWWWKTAMNLIANRYFERRADPSVKGRAPAATKDTSTGKMVDGFQYMASQIQSLKNGSAVVLPGSKDQSGNFLYDLEFLADDKRGDMIQARCDALGIQIHRGLLLTDEAATSNETGSRARSEVHLQALGTMQEEIMDDWLDDVLNPQFVDPLVLYNYGPQALEESETYVRSGGLSEGMRQTLKDVLLRLMDAEQMTANGQRITLAEMLQSRDIAEDLGLPLKTQEEIDAILEAKAKNQEEIGFEDGEEGDPEADEQAVERQLVKSGALDEE